MFGGVRTQAQVCFFEGKARPISRLHLLPVGPRMEWYDHREHPVLETIHPLLGAVLDDDGEPSISLTNPTTFIRKSLQ
jgi:hypothetical protein